VDEERMRPDQWLGQVLCVSSSALIQLVGWQEGHLAHKNPIPPISRGSFGTCTLCLKEKDTTQPPTIISITVVGFQ